MRLLGRSGEQVLERNICVNCLRLKPILTNSCGEETRKVVLDRKLPSTVRPEQNGSSKCEETSQITTIAATQIDKDTDT